MLIASVNAAAPGAGAANSGFMPWIMMGLFAVMFYFLLIRPQSKRQKEHKAMMESIQKGDEVVTAGGILGKVSKVTDSFVILTVSAGVEMKFQKHSITATLPKGTIKAVSE